MTEDGRLAAALTEAACLGRLTLIRRVGHGHSGDTVLELDGPGRLFAKIGSERPVSAAELAREAAALRWLDGRIGAPRVAWSGEVEGRAALVTEALEGIALHDLPPERRETGVIAALEAMRRLHALSAASCPFDERLEVKLAGAQRRMEAGLVDESDFDAERSGRAVAAVWDELIASRPPGEDLVVTHGDACWPNFVLKPDGGAGIIDLGRFGVADRHQDLALFLRSGAWNAPGLDLRPLVLAHYPLAALDEGRLAFFRLLDEFY